MPNAADVPSPPSSPCNKSSKAQGGHTSWKNLAQEERSQDRFEGSSIESVEERSDGSEKTSYGGGVETDGKKGKTGAVRCDLCGDDELSLCSTMVEAPTWEESVTSRVEQVTYIYMCMYIYTCICYENDVRLTKRMSG